jgi:hypothetical protein
VARLQKVGGGETVVVVADPRQVVMLLLPISTPFPAPCLEGGAQRGGMEQVVGGGEVAVAGPAGSTQPLMYSTHSTGGRNEEGVGPVVDRSSEESSSPRES